MIRRFRFLALFAALALIAAACGGDDSSDTTAAPSATTTTAAPATTTTAGGSTDTTAAPTDTTPIIIGAAVDLSQNMAPFNTPANRAAEIMVERINDAGGVLGGRPLELRTLDATVEPDVVKATAIDLIDQGAEILMVTCDFDFAFPAIQEAIQANILTVAPCIGTDAMGPNNLGEEGRIAFSFGDQAQDEGAVLAEFARDQGWETAVVVKNNLLIYFQDVVDAFAVRFEEAGGTVVATEEFTGFDGTIGSVVTAVANEEKDVIAISSGFDDLPAFVFGLRALGDDTPIVCSWACDGTFWYQEGEPLNEFYYNTKVSLFGDDPNQDVQDFLAELTARGGPPATAAWLGGAQAVQAIAEAIEATGGTDAAAMAAYLEGFDNKSLIMGEVTLNADNHTVFGRPHRIMQVTDSMPAFLELRTATSPADIR
ncbi:MAG: ABC transporter substrate-binding protein [Acidimicrobiia bacterium]|nr:ABC transporter substrate-binding protein [Acidimicrobiia bacterium]NNF09637.1 ABC transporter substrate-binding protein [Acidimicrobiia bacterium]NNL71722.1 ABC transporter substrate-binding protein [Acidimicrobiia bacterium]